MTNAVLTEIDRQKRVEEAATWTANENKMAERLTQGFELLAAQGRTDALAVELTPVESLLKQRFVAVSSTAGTLLLPLTTMRLRVTPGQRLSAISNDAGTMSLSITELTK
jgi:hypothetical protein